MVDWTEENARESIFMPSCDHKVEGFKIYLNNLYFDQLLNPLKKLQLTTQKKLDTLGNKGILEGTQAYSYIPKFNSYF
jgi:hypothetical protein